MNFQLSIVESKKYLFVYAKVTSKSYSVLLQGLGWYVIHMRNRRTVGLKVNQGIMLRQGKENSHILGGSG